MVLYCWLLEDAQRAKRCKTRADYLYHEYSIFPILQLTTASYFAKAALESLIIDHMVVTLILDKLKRLLYSGYCCLINLRGI